jgi:hypothetical protein
LEVKVLQAEVDRDRERRSAAGFAPLPGKRA